MKSCRLFEAIANSQQIIESAASYLLSPANSAERILSVDDIRFSIDTTAPNRITLDLAKNETVVLYNSNSHTRVELIRLVVNTPHVSVSDRAGKTIDHQVSLIWPNLENSPSDSGQSDRVLAPDDLSAGLDFEVKSFELLFTVQLDPLSLRTFTIKNVPAAQNDESKTVFYQKELNERNVKEIREKIKQK